MHKTLDHAPTWKTPTITALTTNNTYGKTTSDSESAGNVSAKPGDGVS